MFHQVHAEAIDLISLSPGNHTVSDQLFEHTMFGSGVLAAGGRFYSTGFDIQAVVVTGDCLIQHGAVEQAGGIGVVIDHVLHHAIAHIVHGLDHGAIFADTRQAFAVGGVAAFRGGVVVRIITPVEGINAVEIGEQRLGITGLGIHGAEQLTEGLALVDGAVTAAGGRGFHFTQTSDSIVQIDLTGGLFRNGVDIVGWHQLNGGEASFTQLLEVLDAITFAFGEGQILAVKCRSSLGIGRAEVTNMHLIDDVIFRLGDGGNGLAIPAGRFGICAVQVNQLRVAAGGGE